MEIRIFFFTYNMLCLFSRINLITSSGLKIIPVCYWCYCESSILHMINYHNQNKNKIIIKIPQKQEVHNLMFALPREFHQKRNHHQSLQSSKVHF